MSTGRQKGGDFRLLLITSGWGLVDGMRSGKRLVLLTAASELLRPLDWPMLNACWVPYLAQLTATAFRQTATR
jgi:hypothetical protein